MLFIMYLHAKNQDISGKSHELHKTISISRKCVYTKVLLSIKKRSFNTCIFLIFGSTEGGRPNTAAEACITWRRAEQAMAETFVTFWLWCSSSLTVLPSCALWKSQPCAAMSQPGEMWPLQADYNSRLLEQGLAVIDLKAVMPVCLGSAGQSPDGFCTSGIHLFNGFVQWPTAAKLTDQSTKMQGCDCQLFRGRQIALKGFMGRASSPSSSGSYSSHLWYNVREKEWEKTCLFQTLAPRCNGRWRHPALQQSAFLRCAHSGPENLGMNCSAELGICWERMGTGQATWEADLQLLTSRKDEG